MRFRWNESNPLRDRLLSKIAGARSVVPVELIHSKIVYEVENAYGTNGRTGDGIVTANPQLMPVVTVADCVPLYVFDSVSGAFGAVHSGWKGTGIVGEAVHRLKKRWGAESSSVCAAIGAHIHDCCYIVGEERAAYFMQEFGEECCALTGAERRLRTRIHVYGNLLQRTALDGSGTADSGEERKSNRQLPTRTQPCADPQ